MRFTPLCPAGHLPLKGEIGKTAGLTHNTAHSGMTCC